jgi:ankyrin repeat protein
MVSSNPLHSSTIFREFKFECLTARDCANRFKKFAPHVNTRNQAGETFLHLIAQSNRTGLASLLLHHQAKLENPDKYGNTPFHAVCLFSNERIFYPFVKHIDETKQETLFNASNLLGQTPLMLAVASLELVMKLIEKGADPTHLDNGRNNILHLTIERGYLTSLPYLVKICGKAFLDMANSKGITPRQLLKEKFPDEYEKILISLDQDQNIEMEKLRGENHSLKQENEGNKKRISELEKQNAKVEDELTTARKDLKKAQGAVNQLQSDISTCQANLEAQSAVAADLTQRLVEIHARDLNEKGSMSRRDSLKLIDTIAKALKTS